MTSPSLSNSDGELDDKCHKAGLNHTDFPIKANGLVKQSISVTTANHRKFHLISYYNKDYVTSGLLKVPSYDSFFAHIKIMKGLYPDIPLDLLHTNELANSFKTCKFEITYLTCSPTIPTKKGVSMYPNSQKTTNPEFIDNSIRSHHLQQQYEPKVRLPSVNFGNSATNKLPLPLPFQNVCLDRLPCSEDRRQLNIPSTMISW